MWRNESEAVSWRREMAGLEVEMWRNWVEANSNEDEMWRFKVAIRPERDGMKPGRAAMV
jgi:hypothetical protein